MLEIGILNVKKPGDVVISNRSVFRSSVSLYLDRFHSLKTSLTVRLAFSAISSLFVDPFGRSLWLCHLEFNFIMKPFLIVAGVKMPGIGRCFKERIFFFFL